MDLVRLVRPVRLLGFLGFLCLFHHVEQVLFFEDNKVYHRRILFRVLSHSCRRDSCAGQGAVLDLGLAVLVTV